jgi:hypothetical protein
MPLHSAAMRPWTGPALSAAGLAGAVLGIYWDLLNGRALSPDGIGALQWIAIAASSAVCVAGSLLMALARRARPATVYPERPPETAAARPERPPAEKKRLKKLARKRRRQRKRR